MSGARGIAIYLDDEAARTLEESLRATITEMRRQNRMGELGRAVMEMRGLLVQVELGRAAARRRAA